MRAHTEIGREAEESSGELPERRLESLDDIAREIAERRLHREFSEHLTEKGLRAVRENPDHLEDSETFSEMASTAGIRDTEGLLGWATDQESPAHVRRGEVAQEVATLIHEDLHRHTHPETLREVRNDPVTNQIYEGITEHLTQQAVEGLHEAGVDTIYPEQAEAAERLVAEVGEHALREWFFTNELSAEVQRALEHVFNGTEAPPR